MSEVLMPRLSDSMEEGTIVRWLKAEGDEVKRGEELVEIETDKAIMAYESDFSGTLTIVATEGSSVPVGAVIGQVGSGGSRNAGPAEAVAAAAMRTGAPPIPEPSVGAVQAAPVPPAPPAAATSAATNGHGRGLRASPLARRTARGLGVELSELIGSGPHGRILKSDVLAAAQAHPAPVVSAPVATAGDGDLVQELSRTQALIARRMSESRRHVPDFALEVDVDMGEVVALRAELKAVADPSPSLNDIIVKACAVALRRHPRANGSFADGQFLLRSDVNVAVAVAAEDSLVVPVIREADRKSLGAIARESRALIEGVRARTVAPTELEGGTFTVSNLGMFGIDRFEGIINAPQAAILCVGAVRERPVAHEGQVVIRPVASLTLACDHRILYGADAAAFLDEIRKLLEAPLRMLL
ncbi:MAG TPA: dihydrolipoamide acetyltransferase family protein [Solirubrobacteraceae bacterium]|jgi:pyruvate dehydrogenase E2 component (dihydrolipoamide acetyltransferase)|nr:dihydrolipoamide acetyltransferase family protein [Solirubrobacteraceae bacterium]